VKTLAGDFSGPGTRVDYNHAVTGDQLRHPAEGSGYSGWCLAVQDPDTGSLGELGGIRGGCLGLPV